LRARGNREFSSTSGRVEYAPTILFLSSLRSSVAVWHTNKYSIYTCIDSTYSCT